MQRLSQAEVAKQDKLLRSLRIAQFINCPDCDGQGFVDVRGPRRGTLLECICETCNGTGRIHFDRKPTLLDRWRKLPNWKRANLLTMAAFSGTILFILAVIKIWGL
jgi:hypothetical protein